MSSGEIEIPKMRTSLAGSSSRIESRKSWLKKYNNLIAQFPKHLLPRSEAIMLKLFGEMAFCLCLILTPFAAVAQNQVLGEVQLLGKTKVEKTSGVWVDGQYVGFVNELKDDKKLLLLPGEHEIAVRQAGYMDFSQKVVVEPSKRIVLNVVMVKDPRARFPKVTSQIKLQVTPQRAAVFVDDAFAGSVREFSGTGRAMLVSPGKHRIKIALAGYQEFDTEVNLLAKQKITIKTDLSPGSITQAGPSVKPPR